MLSFEPLCLSTQSVISLSVKTLLKHAGSALFLLKPARLLSKFRHAEFLMLESALWCLRRARKRMMQDNGILSFLLFFRWCENWSD